MIRLKDFSDMNSYRLKTRSFALISLFLSNTVNPEGEDIIMVSIFEVFSEYIVEMNRYLQRIKELEMNKFGLHAKHTMCLYYLGKYPEGLTPGELTRLCCEDKAATSRNLAQLESCGLISREMPKDKRAYRTVYNLTESGLATYESMNERVKAALAGCSIDMDDEKREKFYISMKNILDNLKAYVENSES